MKPQPATPLMSQLNIWLEAFSGLWTILAAFCLVFLIVHLYAAGVRYRMTLSGWFCHMPDGVQIAVATAIVCFAELMTRGGVWWWRAQHGGAPGMTPSIPLGAGAIMGCIGFFWLLRAVSRPLGAWPMFLAAAALVTYLGSMLAR